MSTKVYFRGSREDARQIVFKLKRMLTGHEPDNGVARGVFLAMGFAALSDVKDDFVRKADGGVGEDGNKWPPLTKEYLAYGRRFGPSEAAALKRAAGLGKGNRLAPAKNKGLLTSAQLKLWKRVFAQNMARLLVSLPPGEAKTIAAKKAWAAVKAQGAKTKLEVYGNRQVKILRDTGVLLNSLSPGEMSGAGPDASYSKPSSEGGDEQIFEVLGNGVIVGTNVPYAAANNYGDPKHGIPARTFLPADPPEVWEQRWLDAGTEALEIGARMLLEGGL